MWEEAHDSGAGVLISAEPRRSPPSLCPSLVFPEGMTVSHKHQWQGRSDKETFSFEGPLCQDNDSSGAPRGEMVRPRPLQLMTSLAF